MISLYSGTPGSGKSLEVAQDIVIKLKDKKQNVISNIKINVDFIRGKNYMAAKRKKKFGVFYYLDNSKLCPEFFYLYSMKFHKQGVDGQTLIVLDEAQVFLSPTAVKLRTQKDSSYRQKWLIFFSESRKLGFDIILVSQFDRLIDAQVRCLLEYNVIHRKVNNFKIGWILSLFHVGMFCSVIYWYTVNERVSSKMYFYSRKYSKIYDTNMLFDDKQFLNKQKLLLGLKKACKEVV